MTGSTINYYDGNVYLETEDNPVVIEILYKGKFSGSSSMSNGFLIFARNGKIIITRLTNNKFPNSLFKYNGRFRIKQAIIYTETGKYTAKLETTVHRWGYVSDTWGNSTSEWQTYRENYTNDKNYYHSRGKTNIITNNIKSTSGNLVLKDGTPYYGDVHMHSNGSFMTGKVLTKDSERLYTTKGVKIKRRKR